MADTFRLKSILHPTFLAFFIALFACGTAYAQTEPNKADHDDLPFYFGLSVGYNRSNLNILKNDAFISNPYFQRIEPHASGGIELGLLATAHLSDHWEIRTAPKLIVGGSKYISYYNKATNPYLNVGNSEPTAANNGEIPTTIDNIKLPATIFSFPVHLKLNSDRIGNFRTYIFGGLKYDFNLSANSQEYKNSILAGIYPPPAFRNKSYGYEGGIGFHFYFPFAVISPEIRISNSLQNDHIRDANNPYSSVLSSIKTQMVAFSINIEQ